MSTPKNHLQLIGIARTWLAGQDVLTEAEYRARLGRQFGGRTSAKSLTPVEQQLVLDWLRSLGWSGSVKNVTPGSGRRQLERSPASTKIRALWLFLHMLGEVRDSSEAALAHYVKRQTGVEDLHWLTPQQKSDVIESLKFWAVRPMQADVLAMSLLVLDAPCNDAVKVALSAAAAARNSKAWAPWWTAWTAMRAALDRPVPDAVRKPLTSARAATK